MLLTSESGEVAFELSFTPNVKLVSVARALIADLYGKLLKNTIVSAKLEVVTHELLENAVKYASDAFTRIKVDIRLGEGGPWIRVRVWNRANAAARDRLEQVFREMKSHQNPQDYYVTLMRRTAFEPTGSGLGLARIWTETDMNVGLEIEGDMVCVSAEERLERVSQP